VVVPSDSGLPSAQTERDFLLSQAGNGRQVSSIEATWAGVYDALRSAQYDCLHFTGHGAARAENPDRARIILEQGSEFVPADVSGEAAKLGGAHPLVFLNACQVGQGGMSLTGIGGWANRFLEAGAGAFIGTYWSVFDEPAAKFMEALYPALIGGTSIGEAVKNARAAIKPLGDPTWLAYTVFADPLASV
jgi:CHAT domain-containing protein